MEDKTMMTYKDVNGQDQDAEVILCFKAGNPEKKYVIYTFNEKDRNGMIKLYSSLLTPKDDHYVLEKIEDDKEWTMVKEVMRDVLKEGEK